MIVYPNFLGRLLANTPGNLRLLKAISSALTGVLLVTFFLLGEERDLAFLPEANRYHQFLSILENSAAGYYFQLHPLVAHEATWEDPGMGFFLSTIGMICHKSGLPVPGAGAIYVVELALLLVVFLLPFWGRIFQLPRWYYLLPPLFVLFGLITSYPLFFWSYNLYWASTASAFWISTVLLQLVIWWHGPPLPDRPVPWAPASLLTYGIVLGLIGSFRSGDLSVDLVDILALMLILLATGLVQRRWTSAAKAFLYTLGAFALVAIGAKTVDLAMRGTWLLRDQLYEMKDQPELRYPGHPFWHALYMSLGYVENRYGIQWNDAVGWEHVSRAFPHNEGPIGQERGARKLFFRIVAGEPSLVARNIAAKLITVLARDGVLFAALGVGIAIALLSFSPMLLLGAGVFLATSFMVPLIIMPESDYYLACLAGFHFWFIVGALLVFCPEGGVGHVLEPVGIPRHSKPLGRRAYTLLFVTCVGVTLVPRLFHAGNYGVLLKRTLSEGAFADVKAFFKD